MPKYVEELVSQQVRKSELARERRVEEGKPHINPVVTISRRMGSGARIVAEKLAHDIGWSLWDKEILEAMAHDADVSRRVVDLFDEKAHSELELLAHSMLGDHELGGFLYPRQLARAVAAIARLGNAIILGRGANYLLPNALSIRIDASDEVRVKNMMDHEKLTREQAVEELRRSDRERECFLIQVFGRERVEQVHYDLTIWMDNFTTDSAISIIKAAMKERWEKSL